MGRVLNDCRTKELLKLDYLFINFFRYSMYRINLEYLQQVDVLVQRSQNFGKSKATQFPMRPAGHLKLCECG